MAIGLDASILDLIYTHSSNDVVIFYSLITNLGDPIILVPLALIVCAALLRNNQRRTAFIIGILFAGTGALTSLLKTIFERVRPDLIVHKTIESSYSFPSGHASTSVIIALSVSYLFWQHRTLRPYMILGFGIYVVLIGLSRLYLGVHYPTDILGGWLLASGWFALVLFAARKLSR